MFMNPLVFNKIWRTVWSFLKNLGIKLSYDPGTPLLGIYPEETRIEKDTRTPVFIAALFTIARTWKQPRCPSASEWIKKLQYICTVEYYSTIERNAFEPVLVRWMNLESAIQSEVSQKEKEKYCILTHVYGIQKNSTDEPICTVAIETQINRTDLWTQQRKQRVGRTERVALKHLHYHM